MGYTTPAEVRTLEGLPLPPPTGDGPTDTQLQAAIDLASKLIDEWTGWFFEPRAMTLVLSGNGDSTFLEFDAPVIAIDSVKILDIDGSTLYEYDPLEYVVFNRHLSGGPDDRRFPRIERRQAQCGATIASVLTAGTLAYGKIVWPLGQQNIEIEGTFGYTDPDTGLSPDPDGVTPEPIKSICRKMVLRMVWPRWTSSDLAGTVDDGRLTSEKTRDQSWTKAFPWTGSLAGATGIGAWTGDPEIDRVIMTYKRPAEVCFV